MDCPICNYQGLEDTAESCPSCHADLTALANLHRLKKSYKKQSGMKMIFLILFILALAACAVLVFTGPVKQKKVQEKEMVEQADQTKALNTEIESLKAENTGLKQKVQQLSGELENMRPITHVVKEGESLFLIARTYLGKGELYPRIACYNGIEDPDMILAGTKLIIQK